MLMDCAWDNFQRKADSVYSIIFRCSEYTIKHRYTAPKNYLPIHVGDFKLVF